MSAEGENRRSWEYTGEKETPPPTRRAAVQPRLRAGAWGALLQHHMPFHVPDDGERARLADSLEAIEQALAGGAPQAPDPEIAEYFVESYPGTRDARSESVSPEPAGELDARENALRRIVLRQARLMEHAFLALRLDRYANAPANRGWMNLFRSWGRSFRFNSRFGEYHSLFTLAFLRFYHAHVLGRATIDAEPVPHPWDPPVVTRLPDNVRNEWIIDLPGQGRAWTDGHEVRHMTEMPGVYLDSGIIETTLSDAMPGESADMGAAPAKERASDARGDDGGSSSGTPTAS